ncbi:hypothetical protein E2542_SST07139 [Spatholobus suberectus]|nr:hypothetical protein E2542_SST07139 [Spatholobus suberectus]
MPLPCANLLLLSEFLRWSVRRIAIRYHISENYCQVLELVYVYHVSDDTLSVQVDGGAGGYYRQDNFKHLYLVEAFIGLDIDPPNLDYMAHIMCAFLNNCTIQDTSSEKANTGPLNQMGYSRQILLNFTCLSNFAMYANLSLLQTQKLSRVMQGGKIGYLLTPPGYQNDTGVSRGEDSGHH